VRLELWRSTSKTILYSRNHNNFNKRFPQIVKAFDDLLNETDIDGEVVALDEAGKPDFHRLRHFTARSVGSHHL
jgi:ATP-dependent DNA ligase